MSISSAINAARSGLEVTSLQADTVATNVANASTDGYVRRSVILTENALGGQSSGVLSDGISRSRNQELTAQKRSASSELAHAGVLSENRIRLSEAFGDTAEGTGLVSEMADLEDSLARAAISPESETSLLDAHSAASSVVSKFNELGDLADSLYRSTEADILTSVEAANSTLKTIEALNAQIAGVDRSTSGAAALFDERDRALETLSEYIAFEAVPRDSGAIDIVTDEGVYLLHGTAREIEVSASETSVRPQAAKLTVDNIEITPGAETYSALSTGRIAAHFSFRDGDLAAFSDNLSTIGSDLADRFSSPDVDPTLAAGEPGLFVFDQTAGDITGAGRLSLNPQVDPDQGGQVSRLRDGMGATTVGPTGQSEILQAMTDAMAASQDIDSGGISGRFTSFELVTHTASILGQARISQENSLSTSQAQYTALVESEKAESGVNIDDQMAELLLIEQAYSANARIIQAADEMLQQLIDL